MCCDICELPLQASVLHILSQLLGQGFNVYRTETDEDISTCPISRFHDLSTTQQGHQIQNGPIYLDLGDRRLDNHENNIKVWNYSNN